MDQEYAIKILRVWVFVVVSLIIISYVMSMFGLFGFHGVREKVFVRFLLVSVKRWNKTILLWLRLYVFIRFGEDGLLSLHWNVGMVWSFFAAYWLSEFSDLGNWQRKLIMNKDWGIIGVVCYATRWAPLLYITLLYKALRRNDMYTGLVGLSNATKKCTNKYEAPTRYVFGSFGLGALLNRMVVSWLRVFGIRSSLLICQAPILWFERIMQVLLYIKILRWKCKDVGTYGIAYNFFGNIFGIWAIQGFLIPDYSTHGCESLILF